MKNEIQQDRIMQQRKEVEGIMRYLSNLPARQWRRVKPEGKMDYFETRLDDFWFRVSEDMPKEIARDERKIDDSIERHRLVIGNEKFVGDNTYERTYINDYLGEGKYANHMDEISSLYLRLHIETQSQLMRDFSELNGRLKKENSKKQTSRKGMSFRLRKVKKERLS